MIYVLISREGTEVHDPRVFTTYVKAQKIMENEHEQQLKETYPEEPDRNDFGRIDEWYACVETKGDWFEWTITECDFVE